MFKYGRWENTLPEIAALKKTLRKINDYCGLHRESLSYVVRVYRKFNLAYPQITLWRNIKGPIRNIPAIKSQNYTEALLFYIHKIICLLNINHLVVENQPVLTNKLKFIISLFVGVYLILILRYPHTDTHVHVVMISGKRTSCDVFSYLSHVDPSTSYSRCLQATLRQIYISA